MKLLLTLYSWLYTIPVQQKEKHDGLSTKAQILDECRGINLLTVSSNNAKVNGERYEGIGAFVITLLICASNARRSSQWSPKQSEPQGWQCHLLGEEKVSLR